MKFMEWLPARELEKNSLRKKEAYAMPEEFKPGCARPTGGPVGEAVKTEATQPDI